MNVAEVSSAYVDLGKFWTYDPKSKSKESQFYDNAWIIGDKPIEGTKSLPAAYFYVKGEKDNVGFTPTSIDYDARSGLLSVQGRQEGVDRILQRAYMMNAPAPRFMRVRASERSRRPADLVVKNIIVDMEDSMPNIKAYLGIETEEKEVEDLREPYFNAETYEDIDGKPYSKNLIYYQPDLSDEWDIIGGDAPIQSFEVFKSKKLVEKLFPDAEIMEMSGDDVERPRFIDQEYYAEEFEAPKPQLTKNQLKLLDYLKVSAFNRGGRLGDAYVKTDRKGYDGFKPQLVQKLIDKGIISTSEGSGRIESLKAYTVKLNPIAWEYPFRYGGDKSLKQRGNKIVRNMRIHREETARKLEKQRRRDNMTFAEVYAELFGAEGGEQYDYYTIERDYDEGYMNAREPTLKTNRLFDPLYYTQHMMMNDMSDRISTAFHPNAEVREQSGYGTREKQRDAIFNGLKSWNEQMIEDLNGVKRSIDMELGDRKFEAETFDAEDEEFMYHVYISDYSNSVGFIDDSNRDFENKSDAKRAAEKVAKNEGKGKWVLVVAEIAEDEYEEIIYEITPDGDVYDAEEFGADELAKSRVLDKIIAWHERNQLQGESIQYELDRINWMLENPDKDYDEYPYTYDGGFREGFDAEEDFEVVSVNVGYSIPPERREDGKWMSFGDVVFELSDGKISRISTFGSGDEKSEAREKLVERAKSYLMEEEGF